VGIDEVAPAPSPGRGPPLAILDRDGTLIDVVRDEETGAISVAFHPSHLRLLDGVVEGLTTLASAGFLLAIATNQPGPAKGQYSAEAILRTNAALLLRLAQEGLTIARVKVCMHHPKGGAESPRRGCSRSSSPRRGRTGRGRG
jgi:D-glycero-D-manno-heptose 1,7-bisphosphate phosphatase